MSVKLPEKEDASIDMAPMIDMVFLLLIFFMVASVVTDQKVKVQIPESSHAKVPDNIKGRAVISIDADGNYYYYMHKMSLAEIKTQIKKELGANPNLRVEIRADKRVQFAVCKKLMIACGAVGATDLIFSAFEKSEGTQ